MAPTHPWGQYIYLYVLTKLFRSIVLPIQFLSKRRQKKLDDGVTVKITSIPSRDKGRNIIVHLYQPPGYDKSKPTPVLINLHGSGFILPSLGTDREWCSLVASRTGLLVYDSDYRKAPEYPFPAAPNDAEDVYHYIAAHPELHDLSNVFVSGFSAGGNLALSISCSLGPERIKGTVVVYGSTDTTRHYTAPETKMISGVAITPFMRDTFYNAYMPPGQARNDPRISTIFAPTDSFPKHIYATCGNADTLYVSLENSIKRLQDAGHKDAVFVGLEYEGHGFDKNPPVGSVTEKNKDMVYQGAVDMINRVLAESK